MTGQPIAFRTDVEAVGCFGKKAYASPAQAVRALRLVRNAKGNGRRLGHYRCDCCHQWHLGGQAK